MVDNELGLTAVFNGCIYNYQELRAELEGHGYRFFSTSDTEVMLKGVPPTGAPTSSTHLHGMFAFAIHERDTGRRGAGPRPARHQAALPGRDARRGCASPRTLPALLAGGDVDTAHRPGRAAPLPELPRRRAGAADHPERRPQAAAGDRPGRSSPTAAAREQRLLGAALRAAPRARRAGRPATGRTRSLEALRDRRPPAPGRRRAGRRAALRRPRLQPDRRRCSPRRGRPGWPPSPSASRRSAAGRATSSSTPT